MATLKESALAYVPPQTLNIADVEKFSVDIELKDGKGENQKGEKFEYKFTIIDGKEYRVPGTVLGGIKALLEKKPDMKMVAVLKQGEGMATKYQVIPMD